MEEVADNQSRTLDNERDRRQEATQTLKISESNLTKAREDLKEMTRARDSAEAGLRAPKSRLRTK